MMIAFHKGTLEAHGMGMLLICCLLCNPSHAQNGHGHNGGAFLGALRVNLGRMEAGLDRVADCAGECAKTYTTVPTAGIAIVGPKYFWLEYHGRSGGLIKSKGGKTDPVDPTKPQIVLAAVTSTDPDLERTIDKLRAYADAPHQLVVLHSANLERRVRRAFPNACHLALPDSGNPMMEPPLLLSAGWVWIAEFVAAVTREGTMPPIYQSFLVPGAAGWAKPFQQPSSPKFHPERPVGIASGSLALSYLESLHRAIADLQSDAGREIDAASALMSHARRNGHRVFMVSPTHSLPHQLGLTCDPGIISALAKGWRSPDAELPTQPGDVVLGMAYDAYLDGVDFGDFAPRVRASGASLVWSLASFGINRDSGIAPDEIAIAQSWSTDDAEVSLPGYHHKMAPISGVIASAVFWALQDSLAGDTASGHSAYTRSIVGKPGTVSTVSASTVDAESEWDPSAFLNVGSSRCKLVPTFGGTRFKKPIEIAYDASFDRYFVAEMNVGLVVFPDVSPASRTLYFDLSRAGVDKGTRIYSFTFAPEPNQSRFLYVFTTIPGSKKPGGSRILRYDVTASSVDYESEKLIFEWESWGHTGGSIRFGPDKMLYISIGDGGSDYPADPRQTGQFIGDVFSSVLRINANNPSGRTDGLHFSIPEDNPFVGTPSARGEVWAYGLRNPWRMAFDEITGDLWLGDVGWDRREMVHLIKKGGNYGWSVTEGREILDINGSRGVTPITPPVVDHPHSEAMSITGGIVYHGSELPELYGAYIYGDYESGKIWALHHDPDAGQSPHPIELVDSDVRIVSFAPDRGGEPLIVGHAGTIYKLTNSMEESWSPAEVPRTLSETGIFSSVRDHQLANGAHEFNIRAEMWHGGARAERFVAVPANDSISARSVRSGAGRKTMSQPVEGYPAGTVFGKTLSVESGDDATRIETQLSFFDGLLWRYFTYAWNDDQSDARLVDAVGEVVSVSDRGMPQETWAFLSRTQCTQCHQGPPYVRSSILGFIPEQFSIEPGEDHQLAQLEEFGVVDQSFRKSTTKRLEDPHATDVDLKDRARSYLHTHCGHCHSQHGGAIIPVDLVYDKTLSAMKILDQVPHRGAYGLESPLILKPGSPYESVLLHRFARPGSGRMPPVGGYPIDWNGFRLIRNWIDSQSPSAESFDLSSNAGEALRLLELTGDDTGIKEALSTSSGALALVDAISSDATPDRGALETIAERAKNQQSPHIVDLFRELTSQSEDVESKAIDSSSMSLGAVNPNDVLGLDGDPERGKILLHSGKGQVCLSCHVKDGRGTAVGPPLDSAWDRADRAWLLGSMLEPSQWISPRYAVYQVETISGESVSGLLLSHSVAMVTMWTSDQDDREIPTREISSIQVNDQSLMPPGLLAGWQPQEIADLLAALAPGEEDRSGFAIPDIHFQIQMRWVAMGAVFALAGGLLIVHFRKSARRRHDSHRSRRRKRPSGKSPRDADSPASSDAGRSRSRSQSRNHRRGNASPRGSSSRDPDRTRSRSRDAGQRQRHPQRNGED